MADVAASREQHIERLLDLVIERWGAVPHVAAEIDGWDLIDQLAFTETWAVEDERFAALEVYVAQGILMPDQLERYRPLERIIVQNEPLLRQIMEA